MDPKMILKWQTDLQKSQTDAKEESTQNASKFKADADTALLIKCDKRMYVFNLERVPSLWAAECTFDFELSAA